MTHAVLARAPGKINCYFRVGPPREDGYHSVASLYLAVSLYEDVSATARDDEEIQVSLHPDSTAVSDPESFPLGPDNLVVKAATMLREHTGHYAGVDLCITKRVPIAGGMGGGSADAAATLVACNALWGTGLNREELSRLGARLGADVPFAMEGGAAVGLGVGDELAPLLLRTRTDWVLVPASYGLSTPRVYGMLDRLRAHEEITTPTEVDPAMLGALMEGNPSAAGPEPGTRRRNHHPALRRSGRGNPVGTRPGPRRRPPARRHRNPLTKGAPYRGPPARRRKRLDVLRHPYRP